MRGMLYFSLLHSVYQGSSSNAPASRRPSLCTLPQPPRDYQHYDMHIHVPCLSPPPPYPHTTRPAQKQKRTTSDDDMTPACERHHAVLLINNIWILMRAWMIPSFGVGTVVLRIACVCGNCSDFSCWYLLREIVNDICRSGQYCVLK